MRTVVERIRPDAWRVWLEREGDQFATRELAGEVHKRGPTRYTPAIVSGERGEWLLNAMESYESLAHCVEVIVAIARRWQS
jgi:hypothetical protein